jgi:hypothetical protein
MLRMGQVFVSRGLLYRNKRCARRHDGMKVRLRGAANLLTWPARRRSQAPRPAARHNSIQLFLTRSTRHLNLTFVSACQLVCCTGRSSNQTAEDFQRLAHIKCAPFVSALSRCKG